MEKVTFSSLTEWQNALVQILKRILLIHTFSVGSQERCVTNVCQTPLVLHIWTSLGNSSKINSTIRQMLH